MTESYRFKSWHAAALVAAVAVVVTAVSTQRERYYAKLKRMGFAGEIVVKNSDRQLARLRGVGGL